MNDSFHDRFRGDLCLTADPERVSLSQVHEWLRDEAYWAQGRSRDDVSTSVEHSHLYGVVNADGETLACVRVITDEVTFAWICDVFVASSRRGEGLGTWMVREVVQYWSDSGVRRLLLATRDAHGVYAGVGFSPLATPERFMEIDFRPHF
jgi:GNAT superfamily N-acetyltransferase